MQQVPSGAPFGLEVLHQVLVDGPDNENTGKIFYFSHTKTKCSIFYFNSKAYSQDEVKNFLLENKLDLWAYTDEGDQHE